MRISVVGRFGVAVRARLALVVLVSIAGLALPGAADAALSWSGPTVVNNAGHGQELGGLACPSSTQCTGDDFAGRVVTFNPAAPGTPSPTQIVAGPLGAISCPATNQCTVESQADAITFDPATPGQTTTVSLPSVFGAVVCPTTTVCVAATSSVSGAQLISFDPRGSGSPTVASGVFSNGWVEELACLSATQCVAIDDGGDLASFAPSAPGSAVARPTWMVPYGGDTITCPAANQCSLLGTSPSSGAWTFDPTDPTLNQRFVDADPTGFMNSLSCPSTSQCTASGNGNRITFNPTVPVSNPTPLSTGVAAILFCPTVSLCVGDTSSGLYGTVDPTSSAQPSIGGPIDPSGDPLQAVACASASQCTAVGQAGEEVTFDPAAPGASTRAVIDSGQRMTGVACPSAHQCTAVDGNGEVTFDPTAPGTPAPVALSGGSGATAVACPTVHQCTAMSVNAGDAVPVTFDPSSPSAMTSSPLNVGEGATGVACPSTSQCTVVYDKGGFETTFDPANPSVATGGLIDSQLGNTGFVNGIDCPSAHQCTAADGVGGVATFDPNAPASVTFGAISPGNQAIACAATTLCVTVGGTVAAQGDPNSPGGWTTTSLPGAAFLSSVACGSSSSCVAVDDLGQAYVAAGSGVTQSPINTTLPEIHRAVRVDRTVSASSGAWTGTGPITFTYQWQHCARRCENIAGARNATLKLTRGRLRQKLRVVVTAHNSVGQTTVNSLQVRPVKAKAGRARSARARHRRRRGRP